MGCGGGDSFKWKSKMAFNCVSSFIRIGKYQMSISCFLEDCWSHIHDFQELLKRISTIFRPTSFPSLSTVEILRFPKMTCFKNELEFLASLEYLGGSKFNNMVSGVSDNRAPTEPPKKSHPISSLCPRQQKSWKFAQRLGPKLANSWFLQTLEHQMLAFEAPQRLYRGSIKQL